MNFLHRGALTFDTLVYDTNVGDIRFLKFYQQYFLMGRLAKAINSICRTVSCISEPSEFSLGFNHRVSKTVHNYGNILEYFFFSPLDSYFNRERVSLDEIHEKYAHNGQVSSLK